ncbi:kelch-like protein 40 [Sitodiplosis mosellana]|uniref:kelch-like protein 40 n=1 Tax=Sitodiplosis mosellana TaxID=263140 RepID=UPI0024444E37|nr:kelch-like protein 40 [Sitodiplosis mosellana]
MANIPGAEPIRSDKLPSSNSNSPKAETTEIFGTPNLTGFFESGDFSDFVLRFKDKEFKVNRIVLAAHSDYFKSMFIGDWKENKEKMMTIDEHAHVTSDACEKVIKYMYDGRMETSKLDICVCAVANMWQMGDLKKECEKYMIPQLCTENVVEFGVAANLYGLNNLETAACEYILANATAVMQTDGWNKLENTEFPGSGHFFGEILKIVTRKDEIPQNSSTAKRPKNEST